jgi:hypothetical protein
MSASFEVDTTQLKALMKRLQEKMSTSAEFIADFCESNLIPVLTELASSERNVITGTYADTWEVTPTSDTKVIVTTDAEYWIYLERGTKHIKPIPVVAQAVQEVMDTLPEAIVSYLEST